MNSDFKSKFLLVVYTVCAGIIGWSLYSYYKPQIILGACQDIASRSANVNQKRKIDQDPAGDYDKIFSDCLTDSGIY